MRERSISSRTSGKVLSDVDRLIEAARTGGRSGYRDAANRSVKYDRSFRFAVFLHNRFRFSMPLSNMTADRSELLLSQRLILRDLDGFIEGRIRRIHGRRVADLLLELLSRRFDTVETALQGLRLQYPGYAEKLERRFIRRTALRLEEREYTIMREDGLVSEELYSVLLQGISARRAAAEARPRLDIALKGPVLVRQFPLFADLDKDALKKLSRVLRTRHANAGDIIMRKDSQIKSVYFIASGAVELEAAGQTWRLGRGEMFGKLAILMQKNAPRRGTGDWTVNDFGLRRTTVSTLAEAQPSDARIRAGKRAEMWDRPVCGFAGIK